jgi:prepilin-type N-terminal cleavage/methylation domain-containing protein
MRIKPKANAGLNQGLTLVETLVTIMILALLTSLLLSSYQQFSRFQARQSASAATAEWLSEIRKRAMQQNKACRIEVSPNKNTLEADSDSACGNFPALDLSTFSTGSSAIGFCYRNHDPTQVNPTTAACNRQTTSSGATLTFSPRGTSRLNAVFEFFTGTEQAQTCTLVIQPNGLIRYGTIQSGSCKAND